ncbi:MAG: 23S rRNA (guanosine(2251)-2'-O)-methyltransferase RlmB [Lachnospiraceae bacterium]|nr:23S rRNA (guanosine(2251)-2'-O)-methyltransferase RlmB [Lachnospiraceae bacterium]
MIYDDTNIEGRNPVAEAFRSGRTVDKLFVQKGLTDGPVNTIIRMAKKADTIIKYVPKELLDKMSGTGKHQGVIAQCAAYRYSTVEEILENAASRNEDPFVILLDGIEDPHNLGAIIRTANVSGAHGVIITKNRSAGITPVAAKSSAGAVAFTPVARVTNLTNTIEYLKEKGLWIACADMDGTSLYETDLKGPLGLVIGFEGKGVSRLVREHSDMVVSIPMKGDIDSLNASVAAGVISYEIYRQRYAGN